jgi:pSer/pThr/pTyr-binding forkhead associated (FHA) protein
MFGGVMADLLVQFNGFSQTFAPNSVITVGRSMDCTIFIDDRTVSRLHAELKFDTARNAWVFVDQNSGNGSFHNGKEIQELLIDSDLKIRIGTEESGHYLNLSLVEASVPPVIETVELSEETAQETAPPPPPVELDVPPVPTVIDAALPITESIQVEAPANCGFCTGPVNREFGPRCPVCETFMHKDCWSEFEGCVTYGCSENPDMRKFQGGFNG